jgi:hypothetical protein
VGVVASDTSSLARRIPVNNLLSRHNERGLEMFDTSNRDADSDRRDTRVSRAELWDRALAAAGKFVDPEGAEEVAERHNEYLDRIYG